MIGPSPAKAWTSKPMPVRGDQAAGEPLLGAVEVGGEGQLVERRIAFDRGDLHARRPKDGRFVGRRVGPARGRRPDSARRGERPGASALGPGRSGRRARQACRRRVRACRRRRAPARRPSKNSRLASSRSIDSRRAEGAGGVVDQHRVAVDRGRARRAPNPRVRRRLR